MIEAMGHVNYGGGFQSDSKGLISLTDTYGTQYIWNISKIEMDVVKGWAKSSSDRKFPALSRATITLNTVGDTYLNMKAYQKGYVWVNGKNLGRYWNIGPQQKLFCPGVWLKVGANDILVLDMLTDAVYDITGEKTLTDLNSERLTR